ncbi:hypothetical protein ACNPHQ_26945, partial [Klebsiella pneumoniae]
VLLVLFPQKVASCATRFMYQNVLNSVNNAAIHPWDYSWFVSIMPKNNTFTHQNFTGIRTSLRLS